MIGSGRGGCTLSDHGNSPRKTVAACSVNCFATSAACAVCFCNGGVLGGGGWGGGYEGRVCIMCRGEGLLLSGHQHHSEGWLSGSSGRNCFHKVANLSLNLVGMKLQILQIIF